MFLEKIYTNHGEHIRQDDQRVNSKQEEKYCYKRILLKTIKSNRKKILV